LSRARYTGAVLALAAVYFVAAKFGIDQPVAHGVITPVWAPTGIAIATLVAFGWRLWPGVALGAFIANATSDVPLAVAFGICIGNTLEAVVAAYLLPRSGFSTAMARTRDVVAFVGLAAIVSTAVSATFGVTSLYLGDVLAFADFWPEWLLWWFGDVIGALLVAPAILVWVAHLRARVRVERAPEGLVLLLILGATSVLIFLGGNWKYPYLIFPLLVWAGLRLRQVGAATAVLVVGAIATWGTVHGSVPIGAATATQSVQILQALLAVVGISILMIAATLSERDVAEAEAGASFEHLQEAQRLAHIGSWEWDLGSGQVSWSDEMYRIYGYEIEGSAMTFEKAVERIPEEDRARISENIRAALESGSELELPEIQYRVVRPDGTTRTVRGWGVMRFERGKPASMLGTVQDVTDAVMAEASLEDALQRSREAAERLRELDATKNTFISAVAHDLRAPLATISGFSQALLQRLGDLSEDEVRDILERIGGNAERMSHMLANLLDLDRLERGDIEASLVQVDLSDLVLRIVHGLELDREIHVDRDHVMAWVDEVLMERVIENLILNALRHTPQTAAVWIHLARRPNGAEISVEDEGPGVPDDQKQLIFEAFKRGGDGAAVGTGLGLFLVTRFSELHGGKAWVEDRPGGGAVFRVFVPDRQGGTPERKVVTEPPGESSSVGQRRS